MTKSILLLFITLCLWSVSFCQDGLKDSVQNSANEYMHQYSNDELARIFDSSGRDSWQKPREVIQFLGDIQNKTIVDLGSGSGYFSIRLANAGANVIAADIDPDFLERIREKREKLNMDREKLKTVEISENKLDLDESSADIIFLVNVYHHISNRVEYFHNSNSVLKESGRIVIIDFFMKDMSIGPPKQHKISSEQVLEELKAAGYRNLELNEDLLDYQYIITAYKF